MNYSNHTWITPTFFALIAAIICAAPVVAQDSPVPEGAEVETLASDFGFTEGPHWHQEGFLIFSDIPESTIYQWSPADGSIDVYRRPSGRSNGITVDNDGHLILAQHDGRVSLIEDDGQETPLVTEYQGDRLNSPNDVVVKSDGTIYFTDPPYGVSDEAKELEIHGVYRLSGTGKAQLLTDQFNRPNGLTFSPDESRLYVNDSQSGEIHVFDVNPDGSLSNGELFAVPEDADAEGGPDGMKVDTDGNLYTTGPGGIWIYSPGGEVIDRIPTPESATNLAFGGPDNQTLFITGPDSVFRIELNTTGV